MVMSLWHFLNSGDVIGETNGVFRCRANYDTFSFVVVTKSTLSII